MNYFRCTVGGSGKGNTVTVTCAEEFAGLTITLSKTGKTYTKTCPSTSPYVVTFYGVENGTYTVSGTVDGETYSETVIVQDISCVLTYGFNWRVWVDTASQLDSSDYDSLDEVLEDEKALRELFLEHACVDYMAESAASNEDLETVINNDYCAKWINNSDYALDFLHANEVIADLMDEADKYFYGEWVITDSTTTPPTWGPKGNVPVMTANTAPYGEASCYKLNSSGGGAYLAFDGDGTTWVDQFYGQAGTASQQWIQYKFTQPQCIRAVHYTIWEATTTHSYITSLKVQGSNDGTSFVDVATLENLSGYAQTLSFSNDEYYIYWRIQVVTTNTGSAVLFTILQFYGRELKVSVPTMTSNTAPYGEAIYSTYVPDSGSGYAWNAFDNNNSTYWHNNINVAPDNISDSWIGYKFGIKMVPKMLVYSSRHHGGTSRMPSSIKLQGSDDYSTWTNIEDFTPTSAGSTLQYFSVTDNISYKALRVVLVNGSDRNKDVQTLQFYGLDYSEKEFEAGTTKKWLYDHGVELEEWISDNTSYGTLTKEDSQMLCTQISNSSSDANSPNYCTANAIDLTAYSLARAKVGNKYYNYNTTYINGMKIGRGTGLGALATAQINSGNMPNNASVDISSINQSAYPGIYTNAYSGSYIAISEYWLE